MLQGSKLRIKIGKCMWAHPCNCEYGNTKTKLNFDLRLTGKSNVCFLMSFAITMKSLVIAKRKLGAVAKLWRFFTCFLIKVIEHKCIFFTTWIAFIWSLDYVQQLYGQCPSWILNVVYNFLLISNNNILFLELDMS